jgi:signal peptidase II
MRNAVLIRLGIATAVIAIAADQLCKWWMLDVVDIDARPPIAVTPFFNLVMVWNKGVSFGLFSGHDQPLILSMLALAICAILAAWLMKAHTRLVAFALGLVIGGALGNVIDRLRFGAVADFFDFYIGNAHWPAFNIADSCIFIGVVLLCIDSMVTPSKKDGL